MTVQARYDVRCEALRTLDETDAGLCRASALYTFAMTLITGRGPAADWDVPDTLDASLKFYGLVLRTPDLPDDEAAIWEGLKDWAIVRAFDQVAEHPLKRNKRRKRRAGRIRMRLDRQGINDDGTRRDGEAHYLAAWFVEQLRQHWCSHYGELRCSPGELDAIIDRVIDFTGKTFDLSLNKGRLITVLREPKKRRFTKIFYED